MSAHRIITQLMTECASLPSGAVIVAVSGGPDSLALLYALHESGIAADLHVYHLDHGLRGAQSAADADWVRQCADALGLPHRIEQAHLAVEATNIHNLNEAARIVRYRRLAQYAHLIDAGTILVAHTRDDQAETVLMRLLRGSGPTGIAAMRPILHWNQWAPHDIPGRAQLMRPLLECDRADIVAYCQTRNLIPRHDPSNDKLQNQRVRMRHHILPTLRQEQPQLNAILSRTATLCNDDSEYIAHQITQLWSSIAHQENLSITFRRTSFMALHIALQRAAIRHAIHLLHGSLRGWSLEHIEYIRTAIDTMPHRQQQLPYATMMHLRHDGTTIYLQHATPSAPHIEDLVVINAPSRINCHNGWWLHVTREITQQHDTRWHAFLDPTHHYVVRPRLPGERMGIGHNHHRRLQDIMVDARIPKAHRPHWPVIATIDHVVWIPGVRVDPAFIAAPHTTAFHLSLIHSAEDDNFGYD